MSTENNANESAFPFEETGKSNTSFSPGLTKREYFAAMAMQGLLANNIYHNPNEKHKMIRADALAETACHYSDALLTQLSNK